MSLDAQQMQFATQVPATPLLDKMGQAALKSFDDMINAVIEKCGNAMDACTAAVKDMGKAAVFKPGGELAGGLNSAPPLTPSSSPSPQEKGQGQQIAKEMVPERVREQVVSVGSASKMQVAEVSQEQCGYLAPCATPSAGVRQSQGMSV